MDAEGEMTNDKDEKGWHVDKNINLALIGTMMVQIFLFGWFASNISSRVDQLEKMNGANAWQAERIIRIDEQLKSVSKGVDTLTVLVQTQVQQAASAAVSAASKPH